MIGLAEFLLARVAEDEAEAREAMGATETFEGGDADWCPDWLHAGIRHLVRNVDLECPTHEDADVCGWPHRYAGHHVARWDPARVLAECEAKRRAVGYLGRMATSLREAATAEVTLRLLSLPYVGHPDYRQEWTP